MAIVTSTEVKTLLQISGSTYDTLIETLIPIIQDEIVQYCNNPFHSTNIYYSASTIAFVDSDPDTMTDSDSGFVDAGFTDNIDLHIEGSEDNDSIVHVDTVVAGTLTLASGEYLIAESAGETITLTRVIWPKALKMIACEMINQRMSKQRLSGVKSESLADHSITFGESGGGYSQNIYKQLNKFRKLSWKNEI